MAYSFDGIVFSPAISDSVPRVNRQNVKTKRHVPWGNINVVHVGGLLEGTWASKVRFTPTNAALMITRAQTPEIPGTLIIDGTTYLNALLDQLDGQIITPRREYHFFDISFLIP